MGLHKYLAIKPFNQQSLKKIDGYDRHTQSCWCFTRWSELSGMATLHADHSQYGGVMPTVSTIKYVKLAAGQAMSRIFVYEDT